MSEVPFEIITDILSRVPVKPLLRFRCVSKLWCDLIDSPDFIKTHLHKSLENNTNLILSLGETDTHQNTFCSLDFNSLDTPTVFDNQFNNYVVLGHSCHGLLLLKRDDDDKEEEEEEGQVVLFNPSTRQYRILPATAKYDEEEYMLGYDLFNDDYKVIKLFGYDDDDESPECDTVQAMVYSLKSNLWRKIQDFPYFIMHTLNDSWNGQVNGALHMIVSQSYNFHSPRLIAAFDIANEDFYLVPKPDFLDKEKTMISVDVFDGCLCLVVSYPDYTDIWVMKDYGVKESWTKLLSTSSLKDRFYGFVHPLGYSKSRDEVLLTFNEQKLIWYDLKTKEIKNVEVCGLPKMFQVKVCVGSLVPLDGYGGSVNPRSNLRKRKKANE